VNAAALFCKHCAFDFSMIPEAEITEPAGLITPRRASPKYLLITGALATVLIILVVSLWLHKKNTAQANLIAAAPAPLSSVVSDKAIRSENKILGGEAVTESDVSGLTAYELRILRNVHFARYGRKYEKPGLGEYFYTRPWYQPREDFSENMLTDLDKSNIRIIQTAEDQIINAQSRNWDTFWPMLGDAVQKKDRGTLMKLMPSDFEYDCCSLGDEDHNGDTRDDAFRWWSKSDVNGWNELNKALAGGAVAMTAWPDNVKGRQRKVSPPSANQSRYGGWLAIFELREDGRWYFVSFLVPEGDVE
jgi:hypothetical protein